MTDRYVADVDGKEISLMEDSITGNRVLTEAGLDAGLGRHVVIRTDEGRAALVGTDDPITLRGGKPSFVTFRQGRVHHFKVDGVAWDWGAPAILESTIREVAGVADEDELHLAGAAGAIRRGSVIDLTADGLVHIRVEEPRAEPARVPIVVNGRTREIDGPEATFEDLVGLAFPGVTDLARRDQSLTVVYRRGAPDRPEGSLIAREAVRLYPGAVFNVTATDKS